MKSESTRIIIIGGVAAGMSAASRAHRNNPNAEIIVFEKSGYVSFGACGLPYYVSDDIHKAEDLIAVSLDEFRIERRIDVRLHHEAVSFNPKNKTVLLTNLENGQPVSIQYDKLIIATGARPIIPMIPGIRLENIFVLRSLENGIELKARINQGGIKKVVIVGGGYIGLEMAEAFTKQGLEVTIVEMKDTLMGNVDADISAIIEDEVNSHGCRVIKSDSVIAFDGAEKVESVRLMRNGFLNADIVLITAGIQPNVEFAKTGGVQLGSSGAIAVSPRMQTNVFNVYAAGDCAEVKNLVTGKQDYLPLGTTSNKQGRVAGDSSTGKITSFKGIVATAAVKVFDLEIARTGITEKYAASLKMPVKSVMIKDKSRAGYYPEYKMIIVKLLFDVFSGRMLGAQMVGKEGVAKRIDILATALHKKMTVDEISELDLSYAPPFAPVWDPVLIAAQQASKLVRNQRG